MAETRTYGEFIAAMEGTECMYGQMFLKKWKALATEEQWKEYRPMPLTRDLVLNFAEDMAHYFRDMILGTCTDELYAVRIETGHAFLREIHEKAVVFGIDVKLKEIDTAMTPTEILLAFGAAMVVPERKK